VLTNLQQNPQAFGLFKIPRTKFQFSNQFSMLNNKSSNRS